jgi:hypothetical protein
MRTLVVHLRTRINTILCLSPQPTNFSLYKMTQVLSAFFWMFIMWVSIFLGLVRYRENKLGWASFNFFTTVLALCNLIFLRLTPN